MRQATSLCPGTASHKKLPWLLTASGVACRAGPPAAHVKQSSSTTKPRRAPCCSKSLNRNGRRIDACVAASQVSDTGSTADSAECQAVAVKPKVRRRTERQHFITSRVDVRTANEAVAAADAGPSPQYDLQLSQDGSSASDDEGPASPPLASTPTRPPKRGRRRRRLHPSGSSTSGASSSSDEADPGANNSGRSSAISDLAEAGGASTAVPELPQGAVRPSDTTTRRDHNLKAARSSEPEPEQGKPEQEYTEVSRRSPCTEGAGVGAAAAPPVVPSPHPVLAAAAVTVVVTGTAAETVTAAAATTAMETTAIGSGSESHPFSSVHPDTEADQSTVSNSSSIPPSSTAGLQEGLTDGLSDAKAPVTTQSQRRADTVPPAAEVAPVAVSVQLTLAKAPSTDDTGIEVVYSGAPANTTAGTVERVTAAEMQPVDLLLSVVAAASEAVATAVVEDRMEEAVAVTAEPEAMAAGPATVPVSAATAATLPPEVEVDMEMEIEKGVAADIVGSLWTAAVDDDVLSAPPQDKVASTEQLDAAIDGQQNVFVTAANDADGDGGSTDGASTLSIVSSVDSDTAAGSGSRGAQEAVVASGSRSTPDGELDDTAVAISVLAAAAAAAAAAEGAQHPYPYAPRGATRRRTSTWEVRPPARRPPRVVPYGGGGPQELQTLVNSVIEPTIIDLQGAVVKLSPPLAENGKVDTMPSLALPPAEAGTACTALVPSSTFQIPGWSSVAELNSERLNILSGAALESLAVSNPDPDQGHPMPPSSPAALQRCVDQGSGGGSAAAEASARAVGTGALLLHRDDVTLANGTLQLERNCQLIVTGRRVTLRRVEVVDAESGTWWRQATAFPATCLQTSALINVTSPSSSSNGQYHGSAQRLASPSSYGNRGGPGLQLDDCRIIASGRDRDLLRVDGGIGATVTARYSKLRGGANAAVATQQSMLNLDCCELEGYAAAGVVALSASVRLVGCRLLGAVGSIVGIQAAAGSQVSALGCFLRGHASNLECMGGSLVDMEGCVLSRPDCRYGLTLHPAGATAAGGLRNVTPGPGVGAGRIRLKDCELGHAVQVGGGELELERCTFALRPAPADLAVPPVNITSDPALAAKLAAAVAAIAAPPNASGGAAGNDVRTGAAFAGSVAAAAALRVLECRVSCRGGGGAGGDEREGEAVVVEAARKARVHVSGSLGVLIRRYGSAGTGGTAT